MAIPDNPMVDGIYGSFTLPGRSKPTFVVARSTNVNVAYVCIGTDKGPVVAQFSSLATNPRNPHVEWGQAWKTNDLDWQERVRDEALRVIRRQSNPPVYRTCDG